MAVKQRKKLKPKAKAKPRTNAKPKSGSKARSRVQSRPGPKPRAKKIPSNLKSLPLKQLVAAVRGHLAAAGYDPVLTGRACAAVYMGGRCNPKVLEFVLAEYEVPELADTMGAIGFRRSGLYAYESRRFQLDVIFSPPPLAVGDDMVKGVATLKVRGGSIKLLTPTDCVRQQLSMYYRWADKEAFDEAVEVALKYEIDMPLVKRWSDWEWCSDRYEEFEKKVKGCKAEVEKMRELKAQSMP